ncbi:hypothetical protein OHS58_39315 [Amycolatopsis sp. NBC_00348]|uniref:hypothetical protein n=1 Tax=Amycolatopsis sp. NBC_00348 TaxID=2975956 RepID=UPI002E27103B
MNRTIDEVFDDAVSQLERENRRLESFDKSGEAGKFDHDGFAATSRALSYVVMGGVLEALMRDLPTAIADAVDAMQIERRHLPVSFISIIDSRGFRRSGTDNVASLIARAEIVTQVGLHEIDSRPVDRFADFFKLADGTTIGEKHFKALWLLLGLPDDWKNRPTDSMLISEIQEKRNDVAHWKKDPVAVGRSKGNRDLGDMLSKLIDLLQHIQLHVMDWLDGRQTARAQA